MPAVTRKTIAQWAREAMLDENYGRITAIMLSFDNGYSPKEIDNVVFGAKQWSPEDLETRFLGKCENYCGNTEGQHQFILQAFYATDEKNDATPRNQMSFRYDVQQESYGGIKFDTPTEKGLMTQLMRHTEILTERVMRVTEMAIKASEVTQERILARNNHLETENRDAWDIIREMGNKLMDKRGEHELEQLRYQRNTMAMSQWMRFGPALLNQILGKEIFPQETADSSLIEAVAESLDEQTIQLLASRLKPELWGVLANRFSQVLETRQIQKQRDEKLLVSTKDPEANAAGDIVKAKVEYNDE